MSYEYIEINYMEIVNFYEGIYHKICETVSTDTYGEHYELYDTVSSEEKKEHENEHMRIRGYLERGVWRLGYVEDMLNYSDKNEFFYYAMECLSSMRHRLQHYLENTHWKFPEEVYNYTKYDDLIIDYYQPIRLGEGKFHKLQGERDYWWEYYHDLHHRKVIYYSMIDDIELVRESLIGLEEFIRESIQNNDYKYNISRISDDLEDIIVDIYILEQKRKGVV